MSKWNDDLELSIKVRPLIDKIYNEVFPAHRDINRTSNHKDILDREYHIDVNLSGNATGKITLQEKALRHQFAHYDTFTMEYMQNVEDGIKGEFFSLCSQYYFNGYLNESEDGFDKWMIINVAEFMTATPILLPHDIKGSTSKANFICWTYDTIVELDKRVKCIKAIRR